MLQQLQLVQVELSPLQMLQLPTLQLTGIRFLIRSHIIWNARNAMAMPRLPLLPPHV